MRQETAPARWSADQVLALAPDPAAARAGQALGTPRPWRDTGQSGDPPLIWGSCRGTSRVPYDVCVDVGGPAYRCSCPSYKNPCKHALGLLLLWTAGHVAEQAEPAVPEWARQWRQEREARRERAAGRAARRSDSEAAARTRQRRAARVEAGIDELDRWLNDQVHQGLAGAARAGYQHWDAMAARLVDAQAPGLASSVRRLAGVASAPDRLLTELSLLRLVVTGYRRRDSLPDDLAATVRSRVGFPTSTEDVLAGAPVTDEWSVVGIRDEMEERFNLRRAWLHGTATGRDALILTFAPPGTALPGDLVLGTQFEGDVCFYPGRGNLRALVKCRHSPPKTFPDPPGAAPTIQEALHRYAEAVAADPWLERWPMLVTGVTVVPAPLAESGEAQPWHILDSAGDALPLNRWAPAPWRLLAAAGGGPVTLFGEWGTEGLRPLAMWADGRLVRP